MRENLQHHRVMSDMKAFQAHIDFSCSKDIMLLPGKGPFYFRGMLMVVTLFQWQCQVSLYVIFSLWHINVRFLPAALAAWSWGWVEISLFLFWGCLAFGQTF